MRGYLGVPDLVPSQARADPVAITRLPAILQEDDFLTRCAPGLRRRHRAGVRHARQPRRVRAARLRSRRLPGEARRVGRCRGRRGVDRAAAPTHRRGCRGVAPTGRDGRRHPRCPAARGRPCGDRRRGGVGRHLVVADTRCPLPGSDASAVVITITVPRRRRRGTRARASNASRPRVVPAYLPTG